MGPAVSITAMLLDSHVVDRGSSPGPGGLNSCQARVRACPRSQEENGGEGIAAWPSPQGGRFLAFCLSVSLCLSGERTCPLAKTSQKKFFFDLKTVPKTSKWHNSYVTGLPCCWPWFESWTWQLKSNAGACACVPKIPRGEWRRRDCGMAIPPWGDFSLSVFLSLSASLVSIHAYNKNLSKNINK